MRVCILDMHDYIYIYIYIINDAYTTLASIHIV